MLLVYIFTNKLYINIPDRPVFRPGRGGALDLSASEPLSGEVITLIKGDCFVLCDTPAAASFSCPWSGGGECQASD